jgi:vacuolar-type H+-ATPase subunit I/STV1
MPTGYTEGILNGKIKNFKDFARLCIRAFGAAVHMRDEDLDMSYKPESPSTYHLKEIKVHQKKLEKIKNMSSEDIIKAKKKSLNADKKYHLKEIKKTKLQKEKIDSILKDVKAYRPPTSKHQGIKKFMIEQLEETIRWDCDAKYHDEEITKIENALSVLDAKKIRKEMIDSENQDIQYHTKYYTQEVERCNERNEWARQYFESIEKHESK